MINPIAVEESPMSVNSILEELEYKSSSGVLRYKDVRYLLIRPETIVGFQKAIEETNAGLARDAFFQGGFNGGHLSAKKYREINDLNDTQLIDFMMKMGTEIGWGLFKLRSFDSRQNHLSIIVEQSAFAGAYGQSSSGVCHLIRGVLSGMASILFNKKCVGSEVRCLAKGDEHCHFEIQAL
jgi:predicted hydrocarbon binding protein